MQAYSAYFTPSERAGDLMANRNLCALIDFGETGGSAGREHGVGIQTLAELTPIEVHVRERGGQAANRERIHVHFDRDLPIIDLGGELCRRDLLVAVEGMFAG